MIQGFVNDLAFTDQSGDIVSLNTVTGHHGRLTSEQQSFFETPILIKDKRAQRLAIYGVRLTSQMSLLVDDYQTLTENTVIKNASEAARNGIFSIIEKVLYRNIVVSTDELESEFLADTTTFANYVPESLYISTDAEDVHIYDILDADHNILDWLRFKVDIDGTIVEFKIWINAEAFVEQYTYSVVEVVPPIDLVKLVDPSSITDIYQALKDSATEASELMSAKMSTDNYTDVMEYVTKYIEPISGKVFSLAFYIFYKGAEPGTLDIRIKTKEYLLNSGISEEAVWRARFPDLFVIGQFFIIPLWDQYEERPLNNVYTSIVSHDTIIDKLAVIMYDLTEVQQTKFEVLTAAYNEGMLIAVPDPLNQQDDNIGELHPTYQRYSTQDASFLYQDDTTKEFTTMLNRALAVGSGETVDESLAWTTFDDRVFLSFVVDSWEFHIISKASYLEMLEA